MSLRELSLAGAIVRALRVGFEILGNGFEIHSERSSSLQPEILKSCNFLPALASSYNELEPSSEQTTTYQDQNYDMLQDLAIKMSRILGDLVVHFERSQEAEAKSGTWNELKLTLQRIWKQEDIHALERRFMWFKNILVNNVIPTLK